MATVTGMTAAKIDQELNATITSGDIDEVTGILTLQTRGGQSVAVGNVDTDKAITAALERAYPVGSLFLSAIATNPAVQLGIGTWVSHAVGRTLIGVDPSDPDFDTAGETGGTKTHTLTSAEMPTHAHSINHDHGSTATDGQHDHETQVNTNDGNSLNVAKSASDGAGLTVNSLSNIVKAFGSQHAHDVPAFNGNSGNAGSGQAHNNMMPYITTYIWRRSA